MLINKCTEHCNHRTHNSLPNQLGVNSVYQHQIYDHDQNEYMDVNHKLYIITLHIHHGCIYYQGWIYFDWVYKKTS